MKLKQLLLTGIATAVLGTVSLPYVMQNHAEAAETPHYQFKNYDETPKDNLKRLLDASNTYKAMAKESGQTFYQQQVNQAVYLGKVKLKSNNDSEINTAINHLSKAYNDVFQLHIQSLKDSGEFVKKQAELKTLIAEANDLLKNSHLSMNQDEAQLKKTVTRAQQLTTSNLQSFELINIVDELKQNIKNVKQYSQFVNHK